MVQERERQANRCVQSSVEACVVGMAGRQSLAVRVRHATDRKCSRRLLRNGIDE